MPTAGDEVSVEVAPEPIVDRAIVDSLLEEAFESPITGETIQENDIIVIDEPADDLEVPRAVVDIRQDFDQDEKETEVINTIPEPQAPTEPLNEETVTGELGFGNSDVTWND